MALKIIKYRGIIGCILPPEDKNVLWLDLSDINKPILKVYILGEWVELAGGGVTPTPPKPDEPPLEYPYYFGGSDVEQTIYSISTLLSTMSSSRYLTASGSIVKPYYYIVLPAEVNVSQVVTENNERIQDSFVLKGNLYYNNIRYRLYEFHLNSGLSLDVAITINITQ